LNWQFMGIGCFLVLIKKSKCYKNGNQCGAEEEEEKGGGGGEEVIQLKEKPKKKS
jgi:hypothetical protein